MTRKPTFKAALLPALVAGLSAGGVQAQGGSEQEYVVEEVLVTARKRSETLQDVPFSIAAMTESRLKNTGATNLESMAANVAGISIQNLGPGQSQIAIRGVSAGQIVRDQPGVKEQVGVYMDESVISLSLFTPDLDFYDLNRVEVLRGPQGTLFGSGSLSGTVRYITNEPTFDEEVSGSVSVGGETVDEGEEGYNVKGHLNIPVNEKLAIRGVMYSERFAGYIAARQPNDATNQPDGEVKEDVNDGKRRGFRIGAKFEPNDRLSIKPRVIWQDIEMNGFNRVDTYNILANPYTTTRTRVQLGELEQFTQLEERFEDQFRMFDLEINAEFDDVTLTSITSHTDRDILVLRDATALTASITGAGPQNNPESVYTLDAPLDDSTSVEMLTQELRLSSKGEGAFQWVAGVFYSTVDRNYGQTLFVDGYEDNNTSGVNDTSGPRASKDELYYSRVPYELDQWAVFGEGSLDLTDRLNLTLGARWYDYEETRSLTFDGIFAVQTIEVPGKTEADGISPRALLRFDMNDNVMLNAQVSKGFRLGGINDPLNAPLCNAQDLATYGGNPDFDDETVINYETGAKITLDNGRGTLNIAAFYNDIENLQATLDAGSCSSRVIVNVEEAHSAGIEFELYMRPTANFEYGLSGSFVEAELDSDFTDTNGNPLGGIRDGNQLPTAPELQAAATATYYFPIDDGAWDGYLTGVYQYVGERWTQLADQESNGVQTLRTGIGSPNTQASFNFDPELEAYEIINARLGMRNANWDVALYVNNLTDERAQLSFDRERGGSARQGYRINQPRTYGISTRYDF